MSFITDLFSGGASKLVDSVGNVLDNLTTTKEEKMSLDNEFRKAEFNFNLENKKLDVEVEKAYLADTSSAREMNTRVNENVNASYLSKNVAAFLALGTVLLTFILFGVIVFKKFDPQTKDILIYILGVLSAIDTQIFSFYFGSSQGSKDKSELIKNMK